MKVWERIIEARFGEMVIVNGEHQFGFMPKRSVNDARFALKQLIEFYNREGEQNLHRLYQIGVNF